MDDKLFWETFKQKRDVADPKLQYEIAKFFDLGLCGFEKNATTAFHLYALAAEQGFAIAQNDLGSCFYFGEGVTKDAAKAKMWLEKAIAQGDAVAQHNLALVYDEEENFSETKRLLVSSAEQGYWRACENIGEGYSYGQYGFEEDLKMARAYYKKALENKDFEEAFAAEWDIARIKSRLHEIDKEIAEDEAKLAAARQAERDSVFISYSHKDAGFLEELRPHLDMLRNTNAIKYWDDSEIQPGDDWREEIAKNMRKAKVVIMLISADFFASEFIWTEELPELLAAAEKEGATILCVYTRVCGYERTEIGKRSYQFVKPHGSALTPLAKLQSGEQDEIYALVASRVYELFKD